MKRKMIVISLLLLLMFAAGCTSKPAQTPTDEHTASGETVQVSPLPEAPAPVSTAVLLQTRLEHASLCSCLMEQGARWHLIQAGTLEETQTDAPFLAAIDALEEALTAQPEEFSNVAEDTLWLLDSTPEGGYVLQFLQVGADGSAVSCRSLVFDGETTRYSSEPELLESPCWSTCADAAPETEQQKLLERYNRLCADEPEARFWRVSMVHGSELALGALSMTAAEADVYYPAAQTHGRLILNAGDIEPTQLDALALACLRVTPDDSVVDADEVWLLRGFLAESIGTDELSWDVPISLRTEYSRFYEVKNALLLLLRDLRADDALKEAFLSREDWTLSCEGGSEHTLTARGTQDSLTAHLYAAGVDVDGYCTTSRSVLERLAAEGENAEAVSAELRERFVLAMLRDDQYGRMMSGEFGAAVWSWHEAGGNFLLEVVVQTEDGTELSLSAQLVTTTAGDLILSVCAGEPVQEDTPEENRTLLSQQELSDYLDGHITLGGSLPALCEATENEVPEKLQCGAEILKKGKARFAAELFARLEQLPEDAFAGDAVWTLSDTPRGNLRLECDNLCLIYDAETGEVHEPQETGVSDALLDTLQTRFAQASAAPGIARDGAQVQALTGYLRENPEVFCDDGVSVLEDTAWLLRQAEDGTVLLSFLRESPFCGLSCCSLSATEDGFVMALPQQCLDEGWFLNENEEDYLLRRFALIGCEEQTAERMTQWLAEQAKNAAACAAAEPFLENAPCLRSVLVDAKKALWLTEQTADGTRVLFLSPGDRTYRNQQDDASTLTVQQIYDIDGKIQQGMPGVLWMNCRNVTPSVSEMTVGDFWVHQMLSDILFDATRGFYLLENEPWVTDSVGVGWARFSNGKLELWVLDTGVYVLRSESEDYLLPCGFGVGSRLEAFPAFSEEYTPISEKNATAVVESFQGLIPIAEDEVVGGWYYNCGAPAIYYTMNAEGIITQMILEASV